MALDPEILKIRKWGDTGDRTDPDDSSLTPALSRSTGWPSSFSASDGNNPRRRVFNQLFRELTGLAADVRDQGVLGWDALVDYDQYAIVQSGGILYSATVATGPATSNETDPEAPGQAIWSTISGEITTPSAPNAPAAAAPRSGELDWSWNCPLDGGNAIDSFDFQWRVAGTLAWSASVVVTVTRATLTGLVNGTAIEAQVRARTSFGVSVFSPVGTATPQGTVPGGGSTLALRATAGDGEVDLTWLEPDNGGLTISGYTVQWREQGQSYSSGRQQTSTDTAETVSLTNGTLYFFRARATNSQGSGTWSNETSATPEAEVVPPAPPADTVPEQVPSAPNGVSCGGGIISWTWDTPDDGGQRITSYDLQWREQGNSWSGNVVTTERGGITINGLLANTTYEARVRATNSIGTQTIWSATGSADTDSDVVELETGLSVNYTNNQFISINGANSWTINEAGSYIITMACDLSSALSNEGVRIKVDPSNEVRGATTRMEYEGVIYGRVDCARLNLLSGIGIVTLRAAGNFEVNSIKLEIRRFL